VRGAVEAPDGLMMPRVLQGDGFFRLEMGRAKHPPEVSIILFGFYVSGTFF
jgi:hypothetical protein